MRVSDATQAINDMRAEISKDEDANLMMQALRGQNMNDDNMAAEGAC